MSKVYIGDGAYAEFDGFGVALTAENGTSVTDRVYLEPEVIVSLMKMLAQNFDTEKLVAVLKENT